MTLYRKKVLILYCGSVEDITEKNLSDWLKKMPELDIIAEIDPIFVSSDQENFFSPDFWQTVTKIITKAQKKYDGFVVIHPIETLLYTACAQSFLLHDLKKPIIFTGVQKRNQEDDDQIGIKANLINSVQVATFNLPEVAVMFGNKLIRANLAQQVFGYSLNAFDGPEKAILGKIDFSIRIFEKHIKKVQVLSRFKAELNENVDYLKIQPVFNIKELSQRFKDKSGIFIEGQGHSLPRDLELLFTKIATDIPVVLHDSETDLNEKNIITIKNMTLEAALVKFMYVLAQTKKLAEIKKLMQTDIAGEAIN